jgi:glycosyltransferase involved in cell wall biosynthesis
MLPSISIVLASRNRAASLQHTLASIGRMTVPAAEEVELLLLDNGSTDDTTAVMTAFSAPHVSSRVLYEPDPNKSKALNRALRAAAGTVLLFTDDDVRVPSDWVEGMAAPIRRGEADAVAGGVRLAASLRRPWMRQAHTLALADTAGLDPEAPRLVGANMALHRSVFDRIAGFDPRLGPGRAATGTHEETLVGLQMRAAGLRIASAFDVAVEHHPGPDRLTRGAFAGAMDTLGRSDAYLDYHWRHAPASRGRSAVAMAYWAVRIGARRLVHPLSSNRDEGMPPDEMAWRRFCAYHRQLIAYAGAPRDYDRHGLRPRAARRAEDPSRERPRKPMGAHVSG